MDTAAAKERRKAWRARARADMCRPWFWILMAGLYVATFLLVSLVTIILSLVVPYLPWIPKPYVSTDPPPLILGFYCANLIPALLIIAGPLLYIWGGPSRQIPSSSSKKNESEET